MNTKKILKEKNEMKETIRKNSIDKRWKSDIYGRKTWIIMGLEFCS